MRIFGHGRILQVLQVAFQISGHPGALAGHGSGLIPRLFSVKLEICALKIETQHLRSIRLIEFSNLMTSRLLNEESEGFFFFAFHLNTQRSARRTAAQCANANAQSVETQ